MAKKTVSLAVRIDESLAEETKQYCKLNGVRQSDFLRELLKARIKEVQAPRHITDYYHDTNEKVQSIFDRLKAAEENLQKLTTYLLAGGRGEEFIIPGGTAVEVSMLENKKKEQVLYRIFSKKQSWILSIVEGPENRKV